jgi:hypothetical protein
MLQNLRDIIGYDIQASDKPAGTVHDFYVDDVLWTVRHVVISDAGGLGTQMASVDPDSLGKLDPERRELHVTKSQDQIAGGPNESIDPPAVHQHGHPGDPHLRSIREVEGYKVLGVDATMGSIDGFIADVEEWKIHFVIVTDDGTDTGRKLLVGPGLINQVDFDAKTVHLELDLEHFSRSPAYDASRPIERVEDVVLVASADI